MLRREKLCAGLRSALRMCRKRFVETMRVGRMRLLRNNMFHFLRSAGMRVASMEMHICVVKRSSGIRSGVVGEGESGVAMVAGRGRVVLLRWE
jgi:hypothetical protein